MPSRGCKTEVTLVFAVPIQQVNGGDLWGVNVCLLRFLMDVLQYKAHRNLQWTPSIDSWWHTDPGETAVSTCPRTAWNTPRWWLQLHRTCLGRCIKIIRVVLQVQVHQISICTLHTWHTLFGNIIVMESQISSNFLFFSRDLTLFIRGLFFFDRILLFFISQAAPLQFLAPYTGCAMAEYFRDNGKHAARAAQ